MKEQILLLNDVSTARHNFKLENQHLSELERRVNRHRLEKVTVDKLFRADVEFLQEVDTNQVIYPSEWKMRCSKEPSK